MTEDAERQQAVAEGQGDTATSEDTTAAGSTSEESGERKGFFSGEPAEKAKEPPADEGQASENGEGDSGEGEGEAETAETLDLSFLPEDLRDREEFQGYKSMDEILADLKQGRTQREGVPEKPEDYKVFIPEGVPADEKVVKGFQAVAKDLGLTQAQVDKLVDFHNANILRGLEAQKAMAEEGRKFLKKTWGDQYEANLALADRGFEAFGTKALVDVLTQTGLKDHPAMVHAFANIGKAISEDALVLPEEAPKDILRTAGGEPMFRRQKSA